MEYVFTDISLSNLWMYYTLYWFIYTVTIIIVYLI